MEEDWTAEDQKEWDDWLRTCEELNPGSTGYTSDYD